MLLRVLVMSALVAGLAYLAAALLRRRAVRLRRGTHLELIDALSLGGRHHLALVRAGTRVICVGVSADGLRPITEFDGDDAQRLLAQGTGEPGPRGGGSAGSFAARFQGLLRRPDGEGGGEA